MFKTDIDFFLVAADVLKGTVPLNAVKAGLIKDVSDIGYFFEKSMNPENVSKQTQIHADNQDFKMRVEIRDGNNHLVRIYAVFSPTEKPRIKIGVGDRIQEFFSEGDLMQALKAFAIKTRQTSFLKLDLGTCIDRIKTLKQ